MDKKRKKKIKFIASIIVMLLGAGTIGIALNIVLPKFINVEQNNGTIIGENNGVIKNYTMGGGTAKTQDSESRKAHSEDYEHTYLKDENLLIKGNSLRLEGVLVENYSHAVNSVEFETLFGVDKFKIVFGPDHPNGYKLCLFNDEGGYNLTIDTTNCENTLINEWGEIQEGARIQISPYDFDADEVNELIVCITDGIYGICAVFSYTHVDDITKVNPFKQELCIEMQNEVVLDGNSLQVIVGSARIIDREYKYVDERFMVVSQ